MARRYRISCKNHGIKSHHAANARTEGASYHFQSFIMRLPICKFDDLFTETPPESTERSTTKDTPSLKYSLFAHEMTHFAQAMSTVTGQRLVVDWFTVILKITALLKPEQPLPVPIIQTRKRSSGLNEALKLWNEYMQEANQLVGARLPLRPPSEIVGKDPWTFYEYDFVHPRGGLGTGIALVLTDSTGTCVGVPLQGDAFFEGQAQAVQWLTDGKNLGPNERLKNPLDPNNEASRRSIYYTAIARLVAATLPHLDWLPTTSLLCDVALCSQKPAVSFHRAYNFLKEMKPCTSENLADVRVCLDTFDTMRESRTWIVGRLQNLRTDLANANNSSTTFFMRKIIEKMIGSWKIREQDPFCFLDTKYNKEWIDRCVRRLGAPPIFVGSEMQLGRTIRLVCVDLAGDIDFFKACFSLRGTYYVLHAVFEQGLRTPCPFVKTQTCNWHKTKACSDGDLLNAPVRTEKDGRAFGCHIASAATSLSLYKRQVR